MAYPEGDGGFEAAVPPTQQNAHVMIKHIGNDDVEEGIVIEVEHRDGCGTIADRERDGCMIAAISDSQRHTYVVASKVGSDDPDGSYFERVFPIKNRLRLKYVEEQSFSGDIRILVRTLRVLLSRIVGRP